MSSIVVLTDAWRFYYCCSAVDMRKSFDGLCGVVERFMGKQVEKNKKELFIFLNKNRTHLKLLVHENNGFTLLYRRQKERFTLPQLDAQNGSMQLTAAEVLSLLGGLTLHRLHKRA